MHDCNVPAASLDRATELARLRQLARKVALVHGLSHPQMQELAALVSGIADQPALPVADAARDRLAVLTDRFQPWPEACGSVRALFSSLSSI